VEAACRDSAAQVVADPAPGSNIQDRYEKLIKNTNPKYIVHLLLPLTRLLVALVDVSSVWGFCTVLAQFRDGPASSASSPTPASAPRPRFWPLREGWLSASPV
jgi:hypothetical protein